MEQIMMRELICTIPVPQTPQDLEQAIQFYKTSDLSGVDLFCQWQAIREASLAQNATTPEVDPIPGDDSY
jgi:hypothetical protein